MQQRPVSQRIADGLILLCVLLILCDILALPWALFFAFVRYQPGWTLSGLLEVFAYDFDDGLGNLLHIALAEVWQSPPSAVLAVFLWVLGICAAVILVQGIRILATVADGAPFSAKNGSSLRTAALACFLIAAASLGRTVFSAFWKGLWEALWSYTALFIPAFTMAGLLCLVMAGLFHRAAEMKDENDLTI